MVWASSLILLLTFLQSPGRIVADTKLDLAVDPSGFLGRAAHLWNSTAPFGQVQNQAYGYFFPHGAFFAGGELLGVPPWVTQRLWWALLLIAGFVGIVRLAEALGIGSRPSRVLAAIAFITSPRVLTTLGSISSETLPMMLAPWVLLPVVLALGPHPPEGLSPRRLAARSAIAVALMGAVNAVASIAAVLVSVIWWASHRPERRWRRFTAWWIPAGVLATAWWIVPLLLLGRVSPPFLDFIESSRVTTRWTSPVEVLRGTSSWTPFVSTERLAGAELVTQPVFVLATGLLAALGLAGLLLHGFPRRGTWITILLLGVVGMAVGWSGTMGSPVTETVREFLDGAGAPLRNVHKLEPLIRLPLVLGLAHLLAGAPLPGAVPRPDALRALAHPESDRRVAGSLVAVVLIVAASAPAWAGRLAPEGSYREAPGHWAAAAEWLSANARPADSPDAPAERALVVPGAPFGVQVWGLTRDEPLQPLATTPWAARDAIPLVPPATIRAMDSVQRRIAAGLPSPGLAATIAGQGVRFLVVRNDLDPFASRSARPLLVHRAIEGSPGFTRVADFGAPIGDAPHPATDDDLHGIVGVPHRAEDAPTPTVVTDGDLRPAYPAIEIYRVDAAPEQPTRVGPYLADLREMPVVAGGAEAIARVDASGGAFGTGPAGRPRILASDAAAAGLAPGPVVVTDTPARRETDYGRVDGNSSAIRAPGDPRDTGNSVPDYPSTAPTVDARWTGGRIVTSGSAADATQPGASLPSAGPVAMIDGDPTTAWLSGGMTKAVGQWVRVETDAAIRAGVLRLTTPASTLGPRVTSIRVNTDSGSTTASIPVAGEEIAVNLPPGPTRTVTVTAVGTLDGTWGNQFGIAEMSLTDGGVPVPLRRDVVVPAPPPGSSVDGWLLGQDFPAAPACADGPDRIHCDPALDSDAEEPGRFSRVLTVPTDTEVTPVVRLMPRPGRGLDALLAMPGVLSAEAPGTVSDPRGGRSALVDGDARTSWSADAAEKRPTATVRLPGVRPVAGVLLRLPAGTTPARPSRVTVEAGPVRRSIDVPVGRAELVVELPRVAVDSVRVRIDDWAEVYDRNALGFLFPVTPGLAEITPLGPDGLPAGPSPAPDAPVTAGCTEEGGPSVVIDGHVVPLRIETTRAQLVSGTPIDAIACDPLPTPLAPGERTVTVDPGAAFSVESVALPVPVLRPAVMPQAPIAVDPDEWGPARRTLTIESSYADRALVVPESINAAWTARIGDVELAPVPVNGWQQAWIVPAGVGGDVVLEFGPDGTYRAALAAGLAASALLLPLALWPSRRRAQRAGASVPAARPHARGAVTMTAGVAGSALAMTAIGGVAGLAALVGAATTLVVVGIRRGNAVSARARAALAGAGLAVATAALAAAPWPAADYAGNSWWTQSAALVALAVVSAGPAVAAARTRLPRSSRRPRARRQGSSTSE